MHENNGCSFSCRATDVLTLASAHVGRWSVGLMTNLDLSFFARTGEYGWRQRSDERVLSYAFANIDTCHIHVAKAIIIDSFEASDGLPARVRALLAGVAIVLARWELRWSSHWLLGPWWAINFVGVERIAWLADRYSSPGSRKSYFVHRTFGWGIASLVTTPPFDGGPWLDASLWFLCCYGSVQ